MTETQILNHPVVAATIKQGKKIRVPPKVTLGELTPNNVGTLKKLNQSLFPVNYSDKFYKEVLDTSITPEDYSKLVFYQDLPVGNIICRLEPISLPIPTTITASVLGTSQPPIASSSSASVSDVAPPKASTTEKEPMRLYIMTLGVLAPYRRQGLATKLLQHVISTSISSHSPPPPLPPVSPSKDEPDSKKRKTATSSGDREKALAEKKKEEDKRKNEEDERERERNKPVIESLYLHVQVGNEDSKKFWEKNGFSVTGTVQNYYRKIQPRDAWILERKIEKAPASSS